jgi:MinD-like ATPase involved in chromosome partitioning or flagellar assembly
MSSIVNLNHDEHSRATAATRYLLVCSGRDGVGKSSVCTNLAIVLARSGKNVCILDTDTGVTNIHRLLGITPAYTLADVAAGDCTLRDAVNAGPGNIQLVLDDNHQQVFEQQQRSQQQCFLQQLRDWEQGFDYILIDTPAAEGVNLPYYIDVADELLLVLAPQPATLSETFSLLSHMDTVRKQKPKHVILNMASGSAQAEAAFEKFSATVIKYLDSNVLYCGHIGLDDNIRNGFSLQHPVALYDQKDPSCARFFRLAQSLETQLAPRHDARRALSGQLEHTMKNSPAPIAETRCLPQEQAVTAAVARDDKEQFMQMPAVADELIDIGRLNGEELRAIVDSLITTGKHEFPQNFSEQISQGEPLDGDDGEAGFQQSLLGLLQQNRSTAKSLDQMLNDFLEDKH